MSLRYMIFELGVIKSQQVISAISKQVLRIFDCAEYFLFKTLLYFLGLVGLYRKIVCNKTDKNFKIFRSEIIIFAHDVYKISI